jgi:hypothetical protein
VRSVDEADRATSTSERDELGDRVDERGRARDVVDQDEPSAIAHLIMKSLIDRATPPLFRPREGGLRDAHLDSKSPREVGEHMTTRRISVTAHDHLITCAPLNHVERCRDPLARVAHEDESLFWRAYETRGARSSFAEEVRKLI